MRVDTILNLKNTFDLHMPIDSQNPVSGEVTTRWEYVRSGNGLIIPGQQGGIYLMTREPVELRSSVTNIRDSKGTIVFQVNGEPYVMYITETTPQFDPFGIIVGWKHVIKRELPLLSRRIAPASAN